MHHLLVSISSLLLINGGFSDTKRLDSPAYAGMPAMHILPGTTISSSSQTPTPTRVNYPVTSHVQTPVPIPPAPIPTPIVRPHEVPVAPTIVPIPDVPPLGDTSMSSDTTDDTPTSTSDSSGTASGSTDSTEINTPADDPLTSNPLPEPPKESSIPEHLISSTSVTQHTPNISDSPTSSANAHAQPPLERPLPELPRDVYDTPQYRVLTMGNGYHHAIHPSRIYPEGWFDEVGQKKEKESRKGKEKEGGKENRVHHRSASAIVSSPIQPTSMANLAPTRAPASGSSLTRKFTKTMKRIVRGSTFRRGPRPPTTPMPTPAAFPGSPGTSSISYAHPVNVQSGLPAVAVATNPTAYTSYTLSSLGPIGSPSASSSGGMPVIPGVTTPAPLPATSSTTVSPSMNSNATTTTVTVTSHASLLGQIPTSLTNPLSPGVQLYQPRPFVFDHTNPFSLSSRYAILYRKKLYPSALHLLEAHRFLGIRDEFAERIRLTQNIDDLHVLVAELAPYRRRDWDGVVISRVCRSNINRENPIKLTLSSSKTSFTSNSSSIPTFDAGS